MMARIFRLVLAMISLQLIIVSCGSRKDIVYLQNFKDMETIVNTDSFEPTFKVNDIVSIYVSAFDMEAVAPFNLSTGSGENEQAVDYIVDKDGFIDYPVLGRVQLKGLTVAEAKIKFTQELNTYLKDPIVNIRIKNFRVTVLGGVQNPGTYLISGERITLLEAIGLAGDLDIKGLRKNVMVIRDIDGTKISTRVDLTSKSFLNSPVYFLTQNDVVYVEPNKSAISQSKLDNRITISVSVLSLLISSLAIITR